GEAFPLELTEPASGRHRKTLPIGQSSWTDRHTGGLRQEPLPPGPPAYPRVLSPGRARQIRASGAASPATPTSSAASRNSDPQRAGSSVLSAVTTTSCRRSGPAKHRLVTAVAGTATSRSTWPSVVMRRTHPPPYTATHTPPSSSTASPSGT